MFELDNRGKRSVIVDLEQWEGPALVRRLCRGVDVFITNLTAARQERYELTAAAVHAEAPATVHASMTAYGLEGPDRERAGFDNAAFWARTGIMGIVGQPDCPPGMFRGGEGDHTAGLALLSAVLAALHERDRTGRGGVVDASLFAAGMWTIGSDYSRTLFTRRQPEFRDRRRPANPLANTYRCGDGRWLALVMPQSDRYWPGFCRGVGHQEWEHDPCYASLAARREHTEALTAAIDAELATCPRADWATRFDGAGLIWEPIVELPEVLDDPQAEAAERFAELERPDGSRFSTLAVPFRMPGSEVGPRRPAPDLGGHTHEVLLEHGFDSEEIATLAMSRIFG